MMTLERGCEVVVHAEPRSRGAAEARRNPPPPLGEPA